MESGTDSGSALPPRREEIRPHLMEAPVNSSDGRGDDVYQPDGSEVQDDAGLLDAEDTLDDDGVDDPLDRGWSPPERPWAVEHSGVTAAEGHRGETLDDEVGAARSGRLVAPDEGAHEDEESALIATDVGVDGAGASAEEAAVHIVDEDALSG